MGTRRSPAACGLERPPSSPSLKSLFNRLLKGHSARVLGGAGTREFHLPSGPSRGGQEGSPPARVLVVFLDGPSCQLSRLQEDPRRPTQGAPSPLRPWCSGDGGHSACPPCPRSSPNPRSRRAPGAALARRQRRFLSAEGPLQPPRLSVR